MNILTDGALYVIDLFCSNRSIIELNYTIKAIENF